MNLIFQKPFYRSGSLPPLVSRIIKSSTTRSDFETDTEESYYYYADRFGHHHHHDCGAAGLGGGFVNVFADAAGGAGSGLGESKMTYYKGCIEKRSSRPTTAFKPVELILDASSVLSDNQFSGKQHYHRSYYHRRDKSLPSRNVPVGSSSIVSHTTSSRSSRRSAVPIKHRNLVTSSFIYDHNANNNSSALSKSNFDYMRRHQQFTTDYDFMNDFYGYTTDSGGIGRCDLDFTVSDFVSDQYQQQQQRRDTGRYAAYKSLVTTEETRKKVSGGQEAKYPTMEMTIDLKAPPTVDVPLSNLTVIEGQSARFECVMTGKNCRFMLNNKPKTQHIQI